MGKVGTFLPALVVACAACGFPGPSTLRYGEVHVVAGTPTVYFDVQRHWTEYLTVDGSREKIEHAGVLAVDVDTFRTRYEKDFRFLLGRTRDARGRVFEPRFLGSDTAIIVRDPDRSERELHRDAGEIWGLTLFVEGPTTWVFFLRVPHTRYPEGQRVTTGNHAVVRVHGDTGEMREIPLPNPCVWDWLTVQDPRVAFSTGRDGARFRTWRADFEKGTLDEPIEGDFLVIDSEGNLLERRTCPAFDGGSELPPTGAEIIRDGVRGTVELGLPGRLEVVLNAGWVVLFDAEKRRYVFRSLEGEPDRWLPERPPTRGSVELRPE